MRFAPLSFRGSTIARLLTAVAVGGLLLLAVAWWASGPATPDKFYSWDESPPTQPGRLLRQELFTQQLPSGAVAWRILYSTTRHDGAPAVASAIVMAPRNRPPGARPVILWTHGTTGVVPGCAPALIDATFANVPGLQPLLDRGWIYVAPDYVGQGTAGPHPYLVGEGEARSALDALRAARDLPDLTFADAAVVWGHSQGGHAALWTGIVAPRYAPELTLRGVAAVAPASDLLRLIDHVQHTLIGRVMTSYVLSAYGAHYDDVRFDDYTAGLRAPLSRAMASRCLAGGGALASVALAAVAGGSIFAQSPLTGALARRLGENTPTALPTAPVLLGQGLADDLVLPQVQQGYAKAQCAKGAAWSVVEYAGRDHLSVVAADSPFVDDLVAWTEARFAAVPVPPGCTFARR